MAILALIISVVLSLLSSLIANKIQPHLVNKTRLIIVLFAFFILSSIVLTLAMNDKPSVKDELKVTSLKTVEDSETQIKSLGDGGVISAYWELTLSNTGESNLSVISYQVEQRGEDFPETFYTGLNQGLYIFNNNKFETLNLPLQIEPGNSKKIFIRLGLLVIPDSYKIIKKKFSDSSRAKLKDISTYLFSKGTDFYGNKIKSSSDLTVFTFPKIDEIKEQTFALSLKTSRENNTELLVSWYKHGGGFDRK